MRRVEGKLGFCRLLRGIMCSQSAVNHIPMHMHKRLITGVLRNELNFTNGFVHSDGGCVISCNMGVYQLASTEGEAAALSLRAGVDMDFAGCSYSHLEEGAQTHARFCAIAFVFKSISFAKTGLGQTREITTENRRRIGLRIQRSRRVV